MKRLASRHANATHLLDGKLLRVDGQPVTEVTRYVHDQFRGLVLAHGFPCVAARSAVNTGSYRFGLYDRMASPDATAGLAEDLTRFITDGAAGRNFVTYVACFLSPRPTTANQFERLLFRQLQALHHRDSERFAWDPSVSSDPIDSNFAFSMAGEAFFVAGLHGGSEMWGRVFAYPTLVFNHHKQFRRLREMGKFEPLKETIHGRQVRLQGFANPGLTDHGEGSEARDYAGRLHPAHPAGPWICPFHPRPSEPE